MPRPMEGAVFLVDYFDDMSKSYHGLFANRELTRRCSSQPHEAPKKLRPILKHTAKSSASPHLPGALPFVADVPEEWRDRAQSVLTGLYKTFGANCSPEFIKAQLHAAVLEAEAGVKSAMNAKATAGGYDGDVGNLKSMKAKRRCRFDDVDVEITEKVKEEPFAGKKKSLVDCLTQLLDGMNLESSSAPAPVEVAFQERYGREHDIRRAKEEKYEPILSRKRAFAEEDDEAAAAAAMKTPKRPRRMTVVDEADNNMKLKKIRRTRDLKLSHVMSDENDELDALRRSAARCVEQLLMAALEKDDDN